MSEYKPATAESDIQWTGEALQRMERAPVFLRGMVKRLAERKARELGYTVITAEILDQSHDINRYTSAMGVGYSTHQAVAQTVQVGIQGQLTRIEFWAHRPEDIPGDMRIDFQLLQENEAPFDPATYSLGHIIIPGEQIPLLIPPTIPTDISPLFMSVDLTPLNLYFQAGSYVAATLHPREGGGTRMHIEWERTGTTLLGRVLIRMIALTRGKPIASSVRKSLGRLEAEAPDQVAGT